VARMVGKPNGGTTRAIQNQIANWGEARSTG
jgi:hypothetical protein